VFSILVAVESLLQPASSEAGFFRGPAHAVNRSRHVASIPPVPTKTPASEEAGYSSGRCPRVDGKNLFPEKRRENQRPIFIGGWFEIGARQESEECNSRHVSG
jgi:hypothetical protein